ncbi:Dienelactone hydrolase [Rhypophila decipiens]
MSSQEYLAQPPGPCCATGHIHTGVPRGRIEPVIDIPTYIATPENANGNIVLYLPDVWGISNNASLLADAFADAGYQTLIMDYFLGDDMSVYRKTKDQPLPASFDQAAWRSRHAAFANENVSRWTSAVASQFGTPKTRYAVVGYCFGAPYACNLLATDTVSAGAFAHPTLLKEGNFTSLKQPLLLSCAENDHAFPTEARNKALDILQRAGKRYHLQVFQGVAHGFATRADLDDPYQVWCKEQSIRAIIEWFNLWLKS